MMKRTKLMAALAIVIVTAALCITLAQSTLTIGQSDQWRIEFVDNGGVYNSIALDNNGNPRISYSDSNLKYAWWDNNWHIENVTFFSTYTSIALDSNDRPHISFYHGRLWYVRWDGSSWDFQNVDSDWDAGYCPSIALDSHDRPHISYSYCRVAGWAGGEGAGALRYARWTGENWIVETVGSSENAWDTSIALDDNGYPHISYRVLSDYGGDIIPPPGTVALRYARWTGENWIIETIDNCDGWSSSIALDKESYPHVSYYDARQNALKYASWDGENWLIETVDNSIGVGVTSWDTISMVIDEFDRPHISYSKWLSYSERYLKYAWRDDGSNWSVQTIDNLNGLGLYTSLALDSNGHPHISYSSPSGPLKYATTAPKIYSSAQIEWIVLLVLVVTAIAVLIAWKFLVRRK